MVIKLKKKFKLLLLISFSIGLLIGILYIEDLNIPFGRWAIVLYGIMMIVNLIVLNLEDRKDLYVYSYPLLSIILYVPMNILAGFSFEAQRLYYHSFPRYDVLFLYALFLLVLYMIARGIDALLYKLESNLIFVLTDVISIVAIPYLFIATYFVSPH